MAPVSGAIGSGGPVPAALAEARRAIDGIDARMVDLLAERFAVVEEVVKIKQANGIPALLPDRVEEVVAQVEALAAGKGLPPGIAGALWRTLIAQTIDYENARL
ncbi:chorismate mutase [Xanthobacter pseudotagetidis]|uniref:chorismate mutase n=1 Tax=Xanthobacter pseudotagetidis TaxID=3119911 RepID=UPI00372968DB